METIIQEEQKQEYKGPKTTPKRGQNDQAQKEIVEERNKELTSRGPDPLQIEEVALRIYAINLMNE